MVQFAYNALDERIFKLVDPDGDGAQVATVTYFTYANQQLMTEFVSSGNLFVASHRYVYAPGTDQVLADVAVGSGAAVHWTLGDQEGSIRDVVAVTGLNQYADTAIEYDSFGNVTNGQQAASHLLYAGRELDIETGYYYNRARYYDPQTGRFLSQDPAGFAAGQDPYLYVLNNPLTATDPSGLEARGIYSNNSVSNGGVAVGQTYVPPVTNPVASSAPTSSWNIPSPYGGSITGGTSSYTGYSASNSVSSSVTNYGSSSSNNNSSNEGQYNWLASPVVSGNSLAQIYATSSYDTGYAPVSSYIAPYQSPDYSGSAQLQTSSYGNPYLAYDSSAPLPPLNVGPTVSTSDPKVWNGMKYAGWMMNPGGALLGNGLKALGGKVEGWGESWASSSGVDSGIVGWAEGQVGTALISNGRILNTAGGIADITSSAVDLMHTSVDFGLRTANRTDSITQGVLDAEGYFYGSLCGARQVSEWWQGKDFATNQTMNAWDSWGRLFEGISAGSGAAATFAGVVGYNPPLTGGVRSANPTGALDVSAPQTASLVDSEVAALREMGFSPPPGTRQIPAGIPETWRITPADGPGAVRFYDPAVPYKVNQVRVYPGNPSSPYSNSQVPYVRWQLNGQPLDVNGNVLPTKMSPDAHIPLNDFKFNPELFRK